MVKYHSRVNRIRINKSDKVFDVFITLIAITGLLIVLYPLMHVVACSFSSAKAVQSGRVSFYPVDFSTQAYEVVFDYKDIWIGYLNTIMYTVVGTTLNVVFTILAAYPFSRKDLIGRGIIMKIYVFTMLFSGGLIPSYLLVKNLHLLNTSWSLWLPGLLSVYNVIVMKTYYQTTIPNELLESAQIDGCSNRRFLWSVVIPLSGAIIAVMVLFYGIGHWNNYFSAMLYITDKSKYPLQLFLREILIANTVDYTSLSGSEIKELLKKQEMKLLLKYSLIVVSSFPMLCIYSFVQKYFVKGVMIGSLKG